MNAETATSLPLPDTKPQAPSTEPDDKSKFSWAQFTAGVGPDTFIKVMMQAGAAGVVCLLLWTLQSNFVAITQQDREMFQETVKGLWLEHQEDRRDITGALKGMSRSLDETNQLNREILNEVKRNRRVGDGSFIGPVKPSESNPNGTGQ